MTEGGGGGGGGRAPRRIGRLPARIVPDPELLRVSPDREFRRIELLIDRIPGRWPIGHFAQPLIADGQAPGLGRERTFHTAGAVAVRASRRLVLPEQVRLALRIVPDPVDIDRRLVGRVGIAVDTLVGLFGVQAILEFRDN